MGQLMQGKLNTKKIWFSSQITFKKCMLTQTTVFLSSEGQSKYNELRATMLQGICVASQSCYCTPIHSYCVQFPVAGAPQNFSDISSVQTSVLE